MYFCIVFPKHKFVTKIIEMIQTVVKRDGRIVGFNEQKIAAAKIVEEVEAIEFNFEMMDFTKE